MKASKLIVLVGGILGVLAFFLPLVTVTHGGQQVSVSTFQLVKGLEAAQSVARSDEAARAAAEAGGDAAATLKQADSDLGSLKGVAIGIFVPAVLLALLGGVAVKRGQFGRLGGAGALLLTFAVGAMLTSAAEGEGGIAIKLLLATGAAGVIGGLLALVKPERAPAAAR